MQLQQPVAQVMRQPHGRTQRLAGVLIQQRITPLIGAVRHGVHQVCAILILKQRPANNFVIRKIAVHRFAQHIQAQSLTAGRVHAYLVCKQQRIDFMLEHQNTAADTDHQ